MKQLIILVVATVALLANAEEEEKKNITFDYLLFTQVWPYSVCDAANLLKNDTCLVPPKVTGGWTIHGLWPSRLDGEMGPEFCVPADHFDLDKVKPLMNELLHHWPNLIPQDPVFSLWQHEWLKHGTCAEQVPVISGEFNYFQKGLQLNEKYSIQNILSESGIVPSDEAKFKEADIASAMEKSIGKKPEVHCLKATQEGQVKWYLVDTRICFDKEFNEIDCPQHHKPGINYAHSELLESLGIPDVEQCPPDALLLYVPPRPDHYHDEDYQSAHGYAYNYQENYGGKWDREHHEL